LHALVGALTGNVNGAIGAGTVELATPALVEKINQLDVSKDAKDALLLMAGTGIGAVTGGMAGAVAGANEVANNFLKHEQAAAMQKDFDACKKKSGGCTDNDYLAIRNKYLAQSTQNIAQVQSCIVKGDTACVQNLEGQAASAGEISTQLVGADYNVFVGRQNNVNLYGSVKGSASLFGTDAQQAQEVAKFRQDNCGGMSSSTCDGLVKQALDDRMKRVGVLMLAGTAAGILGSKLGGLRVPNKGSSTVTVETGTTASETSTIVKDVGGKVGKVGVATDAANDASYTANSVVTSEGVANAATYARLKLDLKTTQAANEVVDSLRATGQLPANYVDKAQAAQQGWQPGKALNNSVPGGQLGGDVFNNVPPVNGLPQAVNRTWQEVDIGLSNTMSRSNQPGTRLLYSNDGLLYITTDHYKTVTPIGTWKK
jgi:hypothetical protein